MDLLFCHTVLRFAFPAAVHEDSDSASIGQGSLDGQAPRQMQERQGGEEEEEGDEEGGRGEMRYAKSLANLDLSNFYNTPHPEYIRRHLDFQQQFPCEGFTGGPKYTACLP